MDQVAASCLSLAALSLSMEMSKEDARVCLLHSEPAEREEERYDAALHLRRSACMHHEKRGGKETHAPRRSGKHSGAEIDRRIV